MPGKHIATECMIYFAEKIEVLTHMLTGFAIILAKPGKDDVCNMKN